MSNIHTGVLGTGGNKGAGMSIQRKSQHLWEIAFSDSEQVFTAPTLIGALARAIEYRVDTEVGTQTRATVALLLSHLMGVRT